MKDFYPETETVTALFVDGRYSDALDELERLWEAIPDPKIETVNSHLAVSFGVKIALKLGNLDEAWKWSQRGLAYSGNVNPAGESEFLNGEVAFTRGDLAAASQYFAAARKMSGWRLFKGENPDYRKLVEQGADSDVVGNAAADASNAIRMAVWSGFCSPEDVEELIDELVDEGGDGRLLRKLAKRELAAKRGAESTWPAQTDCDRLDQAFAALEMQGVLCLHNAGYTMSDGHQDAWSVLSDTPGHSFMGYCFYHGQDVERAINGEGLMLAFDRVDDDVAGKVDLGSILREELERLGFEVAWNGSPEDRVCIPNFKWRRRYSANA